MVHETHGIGRYQGLVSMDLGEGEPEMMMLEYADQALYVPVSQLHLISRAGPAARRKTPADQTGLAAMGQGQTARRRKARDTAAELLNLYAQRAAREGHAFALSEDDYAPLPTALPLTKPRPTSRHRRGDCRHDLGQADGPAGVRRCGLWQNRSALRAAFVAVLAANRWRCWRRPPC